ncbi:MAG: glycosyl hydrolase [Caulobacteraceae bacterium]
MTTVGHDRRGTSIVISTLSALLACLAIVAAPSSAASQNGPLVPPSVPATGAYLGAWVNPLGLPSMGGANEIAQLPRFNSYVGEPAAILHVFIQFTDPFPATVLDQVEQNGSIPMLDWGCASVDDIAAGVDDGAISAMAQSLKAFGMPIFLRWYWEMNYNNPNQTTCAGYGRGAQFVAAWRHIWTIFQQTGATNVAFVWCPVSHGDASPYYPGDHYVDWVGADYFDLAHEGTIGFHNGFATFYAQWASDKPMLVGATGATPVDQFQYILGMQQSALTEFPNIKAIMYFDAPGALGNFSLAGNGLSAYKTMADTPYFGDR